jgi:glycosidase
VTATALTVRLRAFPEPESRARAAALPFEFHVLAAARRRYQIEEAFFTFTGNVILADFPAARLFAKRLNDARDLDRHPEQAVRAGQVNAMGLIDEINHAIIRLYEDTANPGVFARALASMRARGTEPALLRFTELLPPRDVYAGTQTAAEFVRASTGSKPHAEVTIEELLLLSVANGNPALHPFQDLIDDRELAESSPYAEAVAGLEAFFRHEPPFGPDALPLLDLLRAPILASPHSLEGQLQYMKERWGLLLSRLLLDRIVGAGDLIREDTKIIFAGGAPGPAVVPTYPPRAGGASEGASDAERFTQDLDWMPNVVLMAKNAFVWLDQLSKRYRRPITRLDQIPDEELDALARWNFTGLWLIGIWERSHASRRIKQLTGNPEAVSSAYSLYEYEIAGDLGGEDAFAELKQRAWRRGIRLAGDMVPNHMGIFSRWVIEHPEYFMQSAASPFPNYRFTGPNLSEDPAVQLRIEDGYWSKTDAAVVFQRIDHRTGETRYLYHGNDGTNMPWNDTAQLDYLRADVREAAMQAILHVASKCPIIRFDAAMTLAKKHFQRLWYPKPGSGGDIPSRADHAMAAEAFDALFPNEFWRDVVDRVNREMPDTLLLAEAFWLLEGYFVRTLGMHRVYNSAFMHMLMKEDNAQYREAIRNTLHYNPEILKRYVNFMSNPDEQTALAQFGRDDKYFGVAVLMVTLPGLPMFGHGQVEGLAEKYGMEYQRAYYDEWPDEHLIRRHEREIFPLMGRRHLFSQVAEFELYDLVDGSGAVNENVFVYSNRAGADRALVCFHNKFEECRGWVKQSAGKTVSAGVEGGAIRSRTLGEALGLSGEEGVWYLFRDHVSGLEYLRPGRELCADGMYFELRAFQYQVFVDFREERDASGTFEQLARMLGGRGVPDVHDALREMALLPLHRAAASLLAELPNAHELFHGSGARDLPARVLRKFETAAAEARKVSKDMEPLEVILGEFTRDLAAISALVGTLAESPAAEAAAIASARREAALLAWSAWHRLHRLASGDPAGRKLRLGPVWAEGLRHAGFPEDEVQRVLALSALAVPYAGLTASDQREFNAAFLTLLRGEAARAAIGVNEYRGVRFYRKEEFDKVLKWFYTVGAVAALAADPARLGKISGTCRDLAGFAARVAAWSDEAEYRLDELERLLGGTVPPGA